MAQSEPVILGSWLSDYMNQADVRTAFNIPSTVTQTWDLCCDACGLGYHMQHEASEWIYDVLRYKVRKLFYSGDTDGSVVTFGSKRWIMNLNWDVETVWNPWKVDE